MWAVATRTDLGSTPLAGAALETLGSLDGWSARQSYPNQSFALDDNCPRHSSPYEILAPLGAGGMGEVYRAKDIRLARASRSKSCPRTFSKQGPRDAFRARSEVFGGAEPPGIAAIYSFEEVSGRHLLRHRAHGEDPGQRLVSGPLPLEESLSRQIAEALEAAHEKGIVHRDLKPANVKVTPDGRVSSSTSASRRSSKAKAGRSAPSVTHSRRSRPTRRPRA